jgi:hypothetical protein
MEENPTMAKARAETTINRPADAVWARVRNFGDVSWVPNTDTCTLDGDVRTITMKGMDDFALVQRLMSHDDANRTLSYALAKEFDLSIIFGPGHVVTTINGTLAVIPQGEDSSLVTYDVETDDFLIEGTHAEYQGAIDNLKALLEG